MTARRANVLALALLMAACAAWETTSPSYAPPPVDAPTPSHPAPDQPPALEEPPAQPVSTAQVAIASVQLLEDCPDPAPEPAADPAAGATRSQASEQERSSQRKGPGGSYRRMCSQSMVQLSVRSDGVGPFKILAVRVLAATSKQVAGTAKLRGPMAWTDASGSYGPWDERTVAGAEVKVSYKLSDPDFTGSEKLVGDSFNTYSGPFMLELDVSIDGERRTIRSPEFIREPPEVMVT